MKYYFPIHLNGGNRGCEAIAKGTAMILQEKKENLIGLCTDIETDTRLGIDKFVTLVPMPRRSLFNRIVLRLYRMIVRNEEKWKELAFRSIYKPLIDEMSHKDVLVSTGGDMMCYGNNQVNYTVNIAKKKGIRSILWGCSIGEENLNAEKLEALRNFSIVYARELLTKEVLEKHGISNVIVYPDPAFILEPEECNLPECFVKGQVVGINLSNYVLGGFDLDTPFGKEVSELFEYIIEKTDYHILLIPHVFWNGQDDRIVCKAIKDKFPSSRISTLDSEKLNYCQIRHIISKCKMFIGARTHAVISAYSTHTPALAIGYSIKSIGIAKDVGMPAWSVVDSRSTRKGEVLSAFKRLVESEQDLRSMLENGMPSYKEQFPLLKKYLQSATNAC